jgi:hypothetical protein
MYVARLKKFSRCLCAEAIMDKKNNEYEFTTLSQHEIRQLENNMNCKNDGCAGKHTILI